MAENKIKYKIAPNEKIPLSNGFSIRVNVYPEKNEIKLEALELFAKSITQEEIITATANIAAFAVFSKKAAKQKEIEIISKP